jgi:hypothetical protein
MKQFTLKACDDIWAGAEDEHPELLQVERPWQRRRILRGIVANIHDQVNAGERDKEKIIAEAARFAEEEYRSIILIAILMGVIGWLTRRFLDWWFDIDGKYLENGAPV